jgi:LysM repeat protein
MPGLGRRADAPARHLEEVFMRTLRLRTLGLTALAALALSLAACTRSASTPPPSGGGAETASPLTGQQATMEAVRSALLTQTAQASPGGAATSTPTAPGLGATSTPGLGTPVVTVIGTSQPLVTPFPSPTPGKPASYTLHEGEFPYCLARRFNVNPDDLLAVNGLANNSVVVPGQTLSIPSGSTFPGPRALLSHPTNYTVKGGDTVYFIACAFGDVDPVAIAAANAISSPYTLTPGSVIRIP